LRTDGLLSSKDIKKIHFTGIGGISMSGLAEILHHQGYTITGSDIKSSSITQKLENLGIEITIGHQAENIDGADLLIYTAAVKPDNPELIAAAHAGIPCMDRATLLGEIMRKYSNSIAVSGTHGKTTTTSMIAMIMIEEGMDPTVHIGGELRAIGGTTRIGSGNYFISEACEYSGSFLKLHPYLAVILNVEYDHADYYENFSKVRDAFTEFSKRVPKEGYLVVNGDDPTAIEILEQSSCNKVTFGIRNSQCDWSAVNITFDNMGCASYTLLNRNKPVCDIKLNVPGIYNVSNSLAAIAASSIMGCSPASAVNALQKFRGAGRRFELKGNVDGITVMDDYAHHPTEVAVTLKAAAGCHYSRIWCVFQPHTYTRTKYLMNDFSTAFEAADIVILTDIYAAREIDTGEVNSSMLAEKIAASGKKVFYFNDFNAITDFLEKNAQSGDLIITMGAGDVYKIGDMFLEARKKLAVS